MKVRESVRTPGRTPPGRWLVLLALPLLLSGCAMFTASKGGNGAASDDSVVTGGDQWLIVSKGSATPSPKPSSSGVRPTPTATSGFIPLPPATPRPKPTATCARDTPHFDKINALEVQPGTTSAKVRWYNVGGYNLVEYRVTAINQDLGVGRQIAVGTVVVKPANPCGYLTATLPKLLRKTSYVFSVDAVVTRRSGDGTHAATVFRSSVVDTK
ncbi:hypothetical protein ACFQFC_33655 [Amorphoplanes digitatis]|uniref:Fibronectin type-III domain-containing protein n=1 Tax=Actinoplanes digitatis TaxID=1868 RepID=A0A7W7MNX1_9ACTN|nr:hypothetical protein [Actinoplanes digitatis]MBB4761107.1 hypothetical protein [Actinoplanes digitatis]GID92723.1 hypothetical protein Adi01nite_21350 [Actinoplanes digitatis]